MSHQESPRYLIDDRVYAMVGSNGYRHGNLRRAEAFAHAEALRAQIAFIGASWTVRIFYRDGSEVTP